MLAALDAQYLTSARAAILEHAADVASETLDLDQALAAATRTRDQDAATQRRQEAVAVANEQHAFGLQQAEFMRVRTVTGNALWQTVNDDFTLADYEYSVDVAAAQQHYSQLAADAAYAQRVAIGNADAYLSGDQTAYNQAVQTAATVYQRALWDAQAIQTHETVDAKDARGEAKNLANKTYAVASHAADRVRVESVANASIDHETELAEIGTGCATTLQSLWGTWANATAQADYGFTSDVATLDKDLTITLQGFETVRSIGRSDAYYAMGETVAANRAAAVSTWATQLATPWADYQEEMVQTQAEYATGLRGLMLEYATDVAAYVLSWVTGEAGASVTLAVAEALASRTETSSVVTALNTYASGAAAVNVASAVQIATASATQDKDKAEIDQTLQDALAIEEQLLNNRLDQATWDYEDIQADTNRDVLKGVITSSQSVAQMAAAEEARLQTIASANVDRANHVAQANRTWTSDSGTARVEFATSAGAVVSGTASSLKALSDAYATNEATAAATRVGSVASAAGTHFVSNVGWQAGLDNQVAGEDRDLTIGVAELEGDKSQDEVTARGVYENTLYAAHATARQLAAQQSNSLLDLYQAAYAAADALWSVQNRDALDDHSESLALVKVSAVNDMAGASYREVLDLSAATMNTMPSEVGAEMGLLLGTGNALLNLGLDVHYAYSMAATSSIAADAQFVVHFAQAEKAYNDELADAQVAWVAAVASAEATLFLSGHTQQDQVARDAEVAIANSTRNAAEETAYIGNIVSVGDAHVTRVAMFGDALISLAYDQGNAGTAFTGRENAASTAFNTASNSANLQYVQMATQAVSTYSQDVTTAATQLTSDAGDAIVALQEQVGAANVTRALAFANAETAYQIPVAAQKAARLDSYADAVGTPDAEFTAAAAVAFADWLAGTQQAFRTYKSEFAQAEMDLSSAKLNGEVLCTSAQSTNRSTFLQQSGTIERTMLLADASSIDNYSAAAVTYGNGFAARLAQADKQVLVDYAMADKQFLMELMTAQKEYQVAVAQDDAAAESQQQISVADAKFSLRVAQEDADLSWKNAVASEIATAMSGDASSLNTLAGDLATHEVTRATGMSSALVSLMTDDAGDETDYAAAQTVASDVFIASSAAVQSDFWKASNQQQVLSLATFAATLGTPWSHFKADLAVARRDWWISQEASYLQQFAGNADANADYHAAAGSAWVGRSSSNDEADNTYAAHVTDAQQTCTTTVADAGVLYAAAIATASETYQKTVAQAERDYQVAVASAQRDLDAGGSQGDYEAALVVANATRTTTLAAAANTYVVAAVAADADYEIAESQAEATLSASAGQANSQLKVGYGAAELAYVIAESAAQQARETSVANSVASYLGQEATSLELAMDTFASAHPSPWASYAQATTAAWRDCVVVSAAAYAQYQVSLAAASTARETDEAEAMASYLVDLANADADQRLAIAEAREEMAVDRQRVRAALVTVTGAVGLLSAQETTDGEDANPDTKPPAPLEKRLGADISSEISSGNFNTAARSEPTSSGAVTIGSTPVLSSDNGSPTRMTTIAYPAETDEQTPYEYNETLVTVGSSEWTRSEQYEQLGRALRNEQKLWKETATSKEELAGWAYYWLDHWRNKVAEVTASEEVKQRNKNWLHGWPPGHEMTKRFKDMSPEERKRLADFCRQRADMKNDLDNLARRECVARDSVQGFITQNGLIDRPPTHMLKPGPSTGQVLMNIPNEVAMGLIPVVGEVGDVEIMLDGDAPAWQRWLAGGSLCANAFSIGFLPNASTVLRSSDEVAYGAGLLRTASNVAHDAEVVRGLIQTLDDFKRLSGFVFKSEKEAEKAFEVYKKASTARIGIVIGHDLDPINQGYNGWQAFRMKADDWTYRINMSWIDGAVDAGKPILIATPYDEIVKGSITWQEIMRAIGRGGKVVFER